MSRAEGGMDTTRMSAVEQDRIARQEREDVARRGLSRRGRLDIAEILGLIPPACRSCGRRDSTVTAAGWCPARTCQAARREAS